MPLNFPYETKGNLVEIDGTGTIDDVRRRMFAEVDAHAAAR
jgi:adenylate kinase